jgi:hypothetical protein
MLGVRLGVGDGGWVDVGRGIVGVWVGWTVLVGGATVAVGAVTVGVKVMPTIGSSSLRQEVNRMVIRINSKTRIKRRIVPCG